jgi:hypothetical protein
LVTLIIFDEVYKLWIFSSLCSLHQHSATTYLLGPDILLSTLFSNTILCSSLSINNSEFLLLFYQHHMYVTFYEVSLVTLTHEIVKEEVGPVSEIFLTYFKNN